VHLVELGGAQDGQRVEELGADLVLAAVAARGRDASDGAQSEAALQHHEHARCSHHRGGR
jgi:hypothetical protein